MAAGSTLLSPKPNRTAAMVRRPPPASARRFHQPRMPPPRSRANTAKVGASVKMRARAAARRRAKPRRASRKVTPRNERFLTFHPKADRHLAIGLCRNARRCARLLVAAGVLPTAGRFPHHPDHYAAARRQSGNDRQSRDRAVGTAARTDPGLDAHDLVVVLRHQPDHAAV